ncbi:type I secretion system permease/ATPase [Thalassobaculum litoreum]|uniref:ATP-binding cassette, subfamily C n=1 Tax=Thalassobaculum litoreum DSM 18839 TaxID=1123362 RepID=A0A8G2BMV5_9PROT|nr:type I secretion system permease/ATPase [Thalassobaculum litoreum]SDG61008.1 ATP-binding cassette, subfamily C [Thalassobaculum litoreum DSM 18839]
MSKKPRTVLHDAVAACKPYLAAVVFFSLFINLLMFVAPLYMLQIYDRVLMSRSTVTLIALSVIAIGLLIVYGVLEAVRSRILTRAGIKIDEKLNAPVFRAIFQGSVRAKGGSSTQALRDMDTLREFLSGGAVLAFCDAPWVPIFIAVGFVLHPVLGLVSLGGSIIIFALALANETSTRSMLQSAGASSLKATNEATTNLRNAEVVQAMGMLPAVMNRWSTRHGEALTQQFDASNRAGAILASSRFVRLALQVTILGAGAFLAVKGEITPGTMIAASIIMGRALAPVEMAVGQWKSFVSGRNAYKRLDELLDHASAQEIPMRLPDPKGDIKIRNISVVPPGGRNLVLNNVSIDLEAGTAIGLVGPSGSGKSSLARALVGVWPTAAGTIRYDGADLKQWDPEHLGPHIGYMPQDVELFSGTVAENIARFQEIDSEAVVAAATKAGVHEMILQLPDGYDTQLGDGGRALSGGQRQRVALARALFGNPKILVLDEPNANLDTDGEQALARALQQAKSEGSTIVVISHRPSLLSVVDVIAVLKDGALMKYGPRETVLGELSKPVQPLALAATSGGQS